MRRDIRALAITLIAASSLVGCDWIHRQTHKNDDAYKKSVQERPLEVPPDLDKPNTSGALTIPDAVPTAAQSAQSAPAGALPAPPSAAPAAVAAPSQGPATSAIPATPVSTSTLAADGLHVADSVDSTWSRVGLALERSGAATILSRDENGRTYEVQTTGQVTEKPGWFKKTITLGMAKGKTTASVKLTLRVTAEGDGSKVAAEGATDPASVEAAQALLATLKARMS